MDELSEIARRVIVGWSSSSSSSSSYSTSKNVFFTLVWVLPCTRAVASSSTAGNSCNGAVGGLVNFRDFSRSELFSSFLEGSLAIGMTMGSVVGVGLIGPERFRGMIDGWSSSSSSSSDAAGFTPSSDAAFDEIGAIGADAWTPISRERGCPSNSGSLIQAAGTPTSLFPVASLILANLSFSSALSACWYCCDTCNLPGPDTDLEVIEGWSSSSGSATK
mmetsp:Transcript_82670/g.129152  ORF Transcript_82670/g.129152 Transcript_82670/m.129152 type:complete len:219 (+) Transcript_82670:1446-2102(+)